MSGNDNGEGFFVFMTVMGGISGIILIVLKVFIPLVQNFMSLP